MNTNKLAINGGEKVFPEGLSGEYIHPRIDEHLEQAIIDQLHTSISIYDRSGIFQTFEKEFCSYHNRKYGVLTNSGTAALWSMYDAIGLKCGDEIICPIYTFFATITPILFTGAIPVFVDSGIDGNIDYNKIENKINEKTKAIVVTHMWGYPCKMDIIKEIADRNNLFLLEDCSHAHGASYKSIPLGGWGDAAAFSLQGNKIITGGEGGILITDKKEIYEKALLLGHYNKRCKNEIDRLSPLYSFATTGKGMKLRAHPLAIRIAHELFLHLDEINYQKQKFAIQIKDCVDKLPGLKVLWPDSFSKCSWYALIIQYNKKELLNVPRDRFVKAMNAEGATEVDIPKSTCPMSHLELFKNPGFLFSDYSEIKSLITETYSTSEWFYNSIIKIPVWDWEENSNIIEKYIDTFEKVVLNIDELAC